MRRANAKLFRQPALACSTAMQVWPEFAETPGEPDAPAHRSPAECWRVPVRCGRGRESIHRAGTARRAATPEKRARVFVLSDRRHGRQCPARFPVCARTTSSPHLEGSDTETDYARIR